MGFYTILNTGQLAGDNLISPGIPVNNCRWASVQLSPDPWSLWIEARRKAEALSENVGVARQGPGIGGPGEHHWPAGLYLF